MLMNFKENLEMYTDDFWYDVFDGGYISPEKLLEDSEEISRINNAIEILKEFREACEEHFGEDFYR
jgi:hypothetical protein